METEMEGFEPEVIIESDSPVCALQAFVEKSESCYYFYLWNMYGSENKVKACWICNRKRAPKELDREALEQGMAPMMSEAYVAHDLNGMELNAEDLEIVWFAEGDAASLLYQGELICVIPGWAGAEKRFFGYSKYAKGTGDYAWELTQAAPVLEKRTRENQAFWEYFDTDYWTQVQDVHMSVLEKFFGQYKKYYAIDGGNFPPKAIITGSRNRVMYGITAGVSMIPMPKVEQYVEDASTENRIELGFATVMQDPFSEKIYSMMSSLAAFPWKECTFFAHGHTIPYHGIEGFEALLFVNPKVIPEMEQPQYEGGLDYSINMLWLVPITKEEYEFAVSQGSNELLGKAKDMVKDVHIFDGIPKFI